MKGKRVFIYIIILLFFSLNGLLAQSVTDADGNIYLTVNIGKQVWMAANLKTTKFNDGKAIPLVTDEMKWKSLQTPGYCFYNNDPANKEIYGALYNYYTVNTKKICPKGWHVPTDAGMENNGRFSGR